MSVNRPVSIEEAYLCIIEDTINRSTSLQSPAVLEQLKQRWIERLRERLATPVPAPAKVKETVQHPSLDKTILGTQTLRLSQPIHQPIGQPTPSSSSAKPVVEVNTFSTPAPSKSKPIQIIIGKSPPPTPAPAKPAAPPSFPPSSPPPPPSPPAVITPTQPTVSDSATTINDEDDDWDTATWETAPKVKDEEKAPNQEESLQKQDHVPISSDATPALRKEDEKLKRLYDDEEEFDEETLSDLEDTEPEYPTTTCEEISSERFMED